VSVYLQFLQKTHFKSPRTGGDHLFTNIDRTLTIISCAQIKL